MYWRNLPHWHPPAATLFVTWRLAGTLCRLDRSCHSGRIFVQQDRLLDRSAGGPVWLSQPHIAGCVVACLRENQGTHYDLCAFVVMPNHVHLLIRPSVELALITRAIKGKSARLANAMLGRTGQSFWQDESFDHWIRHPKQFEKVKRYIEWNPVRAGLVQAPEEWPHSSAAAPLESDHRLKPVPPSCQTGTPEI